MEAGETEAMQNVVQNLRDNLIGKPNSDVSSFIIEVHHLAALTSHQLWTNDTNINSPKDLRYESLRRRSMFCGDLNLHIQKSKVRQIQAPIYYHCFSDLV